MPKMLDPSDPANYPAQSGNELQEIINYANYQADKYKQSSKGDIYVLIMRLAAYVKTMEGPM